MVQAGVMARDQVLVTHAAREAVRAAAVDADPAADGAGRRAGGPARRRPARRQRGRVGAGRTWRPGRVVVPYRAPDAGCRSMAAFVDDVELHAAATMRVER